VTTAWFVAGFTAVFVALGLSATALGELLRDHQSTLTRLSGALMLSMSIFLLGSLFLRAPWLYQEKRFHPQLGRYGNAVLLAEQHQARYAESPDYCFALGDVLLSWAAAEPARGPQLVGVIESAWLRAIAIGERPELTDSVRGRGSFLAAHNLAVLYAGLGRDDEASHWRARERAMRDDVAARTENRPG